jgi:hypothetical protein
MSGKTILLIIILAGLAYFYNAKRPVCRADFIPAYVLLDGWNCVPGYKPDRPLEEQH